MAGGVNYPNRREIVAPDGAYDPSLEPAWLDALDAFYAAAGLPSGPQIATLSASVLPPGCSIGMHRGVAYLRGYDAAIHPAIKDLLAQQESQLAAASQAAQARANRRATLRALRDGSGDLTAKQLTAVLRILVREVLGDD